MVLGYVRLVKQEKSKKGKDFEKGSEDRSY